MAGINQYQRALLEAYPNIDLLPMDAADDADVLRAVAEGTGDGLFDFLWRDLQDQAEEEPAHVEKSLMQARNDIEAVMTHIANVVRPSSAPSA